jgi:hypothetical protein
MVHREATNLLRHVNVQDEVHIAAPLEGPPARGTKARVRQQAVRGTLAIDHVVFCFGYTTNHRTIFVLPVPMVALGKFEPSVTTGNGVIK